MPVLDTSFVIDFMRGHADAVRLMRLLAQGSAPPSVTSMTIFELFHGVGSSTRRPEEEQKVEQFLDGVLPLDIGPEAARMAGLLLAQMERRGDPISLVDLLIGCSAVHHGQAIVTRNHRDFERIPGLDVLGYTD